MSREPCNTWIRDAKCVREATMLLGGGGYRWFYRFDGGGGWILGVSCRKGSWANTQLCARMSREPCNTWIRDGKCVREATMLLGGGGWSTPKHEADHAECERANPSRS